MSINHVLAVMPVTDIAASNAWYERLLGRPCDNNPMDSLVEWWVTGTGWVQVYNDPERAGSTMLNFAVDDLDKHIAELAERGLHAGSLDDASKGVRLAIFLDPDGNRITLIGNFREKY